MCFAMTTSRPSLFSRIKMVLIVLTLTLCIQSELLALYNCIGDIVFSIVVGARLYVLSFWRTASLNSGMSFRNFSIVCAVLITHVG